MRMNSTGAAVLLVVAAATLLCCRSEEPVGPQEQPYIPLITNLWRDVADENHTFSFNAQQESVQTGTFNGSETTSLGVVYDTLSGTFSNRSISFTVRRRGIDTTYAGRFVADTLIDFSGLRLFRRATLDFPRSGRD